MMRRIGLLAVLTVSLLTTAPPASAQGAPGCHWEKWTTTPGGNTYDVLVCDTDGDGRMDAFIVFGWLPGPFGIRILVPIAGGQDLNGDGDFNDPGERWGHYQ